MFASVALKSLLLPPDHQGFLDFLVGWALLSEADARRAAAAATRVGAGIEKTLLELGLIEEDALFQALAACLELPFVELGEVDRGLMAELTLSPDFLRRVEVVPMARERDVALIATADSGAGDVLQAIAFRSGVPVRAVIATPSAVQAALSQLTTADTPLAAEDAAQSDVERLMALANHGPVIKTVNDMIGMAATAGASDIHIEADASGAAVRFRVNGALHTERRLNSATRAAVASRLKVMASLNISEKRRPQDGRCSVSVRGRALDIRLSTLPTQHGESVVLRLLDQKRLQLDWAALGFARQRTLDLRRLLAAPNGIILVAGPTGSGKTTTLYTALAELNVPDRKIVTVEDPVEYSMAGVNQVQVETAIEMSFARALRAILRQDPDVIMVGEIRDEETAGIAVRAALVGRLVLSTVHTNDSLAAIDRLTDLGVPPYLLAATLRGVLSQRLVRKTCPICVGKGCVSCAETGATGRTVVSELLVSSTELSAAISAGAGRGELERIAREQGFQSLAEDGMRLIAVQQVRDEDLLRALGASQDGSTPV